ncbi:MAG: protein kinase [Cyanobacteriota bacterium]|nr:protein kinase [Cyanobacteriota bacterium]
MSFCLNPHCDRPQNPTERTFCQNCDRPLLLGDRYRAIAPLGAGSFGHTFMAVDERKPSKPQCIIKQFRSDRRDARTHTKAIDLFRQEAIRLEELGKHPQIPELLAHFDFDDGLYLIQEFIDGDNLEQELAELGPFDEAKIRQLLADILPVLQFVHDRRIIHRDIKPANIIRRRFHGDREALVLVDFGASKLVTGTGLTRTGTSIGSAGFAAPEQSIGKAVLQSDLYSLGVTCIYLLTQIPPFELFDSSEGKWVWQDYLVDNPVSDSLARVLDKLLESGTRRRYPSARITLQALESETFSPLQNPPATDPASRVVASPSTQQAKPTEEEKRSRCQTTYMLWVLGLVGAISTSGINVVGGLHRWYNGQFWIGVFWMIPFVGELGALVDGFLVSGIVDEYYDKMRGKLGVSATGVPLSANAAETEVIGEPQRERQRQKILKVARERGGTLSVTQAVMDTGMSFAEVEGLLDEMENLKYISVEHHPTTGIAIYHFPNL